MRFTVTLAAYGEESTTFSVEAKTAEEAKIKASHRFLNERPELHPFHVKVVRLAPAGGDPNQPAKRVTDIAARDRSPKPKMR